MSCVAERQDLLFGAHLVNRYACLAEVFESRRFLVHGTFASTKPGNQYGRRCSQPTLFPQPERTEAIFATVTPKMGPA
jgi:hypothetical protein